jgi:regulatory protein
MRKATGRELAVPQGGVVTSLVPRKRRPERVSVYIEGSFAFEVDAGLVHGAGLRVGELLTAEARQGLLDSDQPYLARARALDLLAIRDRSSEEVRTRLRRAGFAPRTVDDVIVWLQGLGYLDDERFARSYALEKMRSGWGGRRVRQELWRKGVEREVVESVLAECEVDEESLRGQEDALWTQMQRRFGSKFRTDPEATERRLEGFLARRGYDWDSIAQLVRKLRSEAEQAP